MSTRQCQCEHAAHFRDEHELTPNGNPGHYYGAHFREAYVTTVDTGFGPFVVCFDCVLDCQMSTKIERGLCNADRDELESLADQIENLARQNRVGKLEAKELFGLAWDIKQIARHEKTSLAIVEGD